jgi:large subunit ribosomal protein L30
MAEEKSGKIAVVLIRGLAGVTKSVKDTLLMLNLTRKNNCVVIDNTAINKGMLKKVKDYVTWGNIDDETFKELVDKRGKLILGRQRKSLEFAGKKYKKYFTLNPPRKGFGRKGIKMAFKIGGALGDREEKINNLIKRMI